MLVRVMSLDGNAFPKGEIRTMNTKNFYHKPDHDKFYYYGFYVADKTFDGMDSTRFAIEVI